MYYIIVSYYNYESCTPQTETKKFDDFNKVLVCLHNLYHNCSIKIFNISISKHF